MDKRLANEANQLRLPPWIYYSPGCDRATQPRFQFSPVATGGIAAKKNKNKKII